MPSDGRDFLAGASSPGQAASSSFPQSMRHTAIRQARLPDPFGQVVVEVLGPRPPGQHHPFALASAEVIPHPAVTGGEAIDMPEPYGTHLKSAQLSPSEVKITLASRGKHRERKTTQVTPAHVSRRQSAQQNG